MTAATGRNGDSEADRVTHVADDVSHASFDPLSPLTFLVRTLRAAPGDLAVVYGERRLTWRDFGELVGRFAAALQREGIERGDRVAVLLPNVPEHLAATFAVPLAGGVLVAINTRLSTAEVSYILDHSGARVLLVDPELAAQVAPDSASRVRIVNVPDHVAGVTEPRLPGAGFDDWIEGVEPLPIENTTADELDLIALNYTSGTTGQPKGVMYRHRSVALNAMGQLGSLRLGPDTIYLWTLPMFHCNGWCMPWAITAAGGTHVCLRAVRAPEVLDIIDAEQVTHFCCAPTVLRLLAADPAAASARFAHVVHAYTGGAPPSPTDLLQMKAMGIEVTHLYGLTETHGPHVICETRPEWRDLPLEERATLLARQGLPYLHATYLRVVDAETMTDVPADGETLGEVVMRGNNVMAGYYRDPEATAEVLRDGWFHSGDLAVMHPDGYIELRDRSKDVIISGGENISSVEIEHVLYGHPAVYEVAVVGVPDERWGETPRAYVTLKPGAHATDDELIAFARERLARYKSPRSIEFRDLPKTSTGKIQKYLLRSEAWAGHTRRIG